MMKLVVLGAVASSCLAFGVRLSEEGVGRGSPWFIIVMEGLLAPLALAIIAFPLLRRGQLKDWLILALVATSVLVALGFTVFVMVMVVGEQISGRGPRLDFTSLVIGSFFIAAFGLILLYLLRGIVPARCPDCRRLMLLPDAKFRVRPEVTRGRSYQCLGCRGRFQKPLGRWEPIPTEPGTPHPTAPGHPEQH